MTTAPKRLRVLIVGGGLSGLALANGLLNAVTIAPIDVAVFEREKDEYLDERGGYQIRLSKNGIDSLRECLDTRTYAEVKARYGTGSAEAPTLIDPTTTKSLVRLADVKLYNKSKAISRRVLRGYLLRKVIAYNAIKFGRRAIAFDVIYADEGERVKVFFEDGTHEVGDILIAADGSKSLISDQIGLNNRTQIHGGFHLTSRGPINEAVVSKLPKVLQDDGAVVFFGNRSFGYISMYRTADPGDISTIADRPYLHDPHLYWAVSFPGHTPPKFDESVALNLKIAQKNHAKELMQSKGFHHSLQDILDVGSVETVRLTTEMQTSTQPPHDWRAQAERRIGKNGGHNRVFLIGDSIHPMTPSRGMGANQALCDAAVLVPALVALSRSFVDASPEEMIQLVEKTNADFENEMLPRTFGWVNASNRSAEMDVTTRQGRIILFFVWIITLVAGFLVEALEVLNIKESNDPKF